MLGLQAPFVPADFPLCLLLCIQQGLLAHSREDGRYNLLFQGIELQLQFLIIQRLGCFDFQHDPVQRADDLLHHCFQCRKLISLRSSQESLQVPAGPFQQVQQLLPVRIIFGRLGCSIVAADPTLLLALMFDQNGLRAVGEAVHLTDRLSPFGSFIESPVHPTQHHRQGNSGISQGFDQRPVQWREGSGLPTPFLEMLLDLGKVIEVILHGAESSAPPESPSPVLSEEDFSRG